MSPLLVPAALRILSRLPSPTVIYTPPFAPMSTFAAPATHQTTTPFTYTFSQAVDTSADFAPYPFAHSARPNARRRSNFISCLRFDTKGDSLAIGDDRGRIILLDKPSHKSRSAQPFVYIPPPSLPYRGPTYLSHESYLRMCSSSPYFPHSVPCDIPDSVRTAQNPAADDQDDCDDPFDQDDDYDWSHHCIYSYGTSFESPHIPFHNRRQRPAAQKPRTPSSNFAYYAQFQSHNPQLDYLSSTDIDETVNQIDWFKPVSNSQRLISCNDRVVKVWRLSERNLKTVACLFPSQTTATSIRTPSRASLSASKPVTTRNRSLPLYQRKPQPPESLLQLPRLETTGKSVDVTERRVMSDVHTYRINSLSVSHDEELFLSSDDLCIHLWNLNARTSSGAPQGGFTIVDIRPNSIKDLTEVITSAKFHPYHSSMFAYATSRGCVKLCDLRAAGHCAAYARKFEDMSSRRRRGTFLTELVASISNIKLSTDGRYILTRDFLNMTLWDTNMENCPLLVVPVNENLRPRLGECYDNDYIFDKFECAFSKDGRTLLTGGYDSMFHSYSAVTGRRSSIQATGNFSDYKMWTSQSSSFPSHSSAFGDASNMVSGSTHSDLFDPTKRILYMDTSPSENIAAVASDHTLYIFQG